MAVTRTMKEEQAFPERTGAMILPGVTLFPHALLPLHIFEPRYRRMLAAALDGARMFAIAHTDENGGLAPIGGLGVVRACVANEDGTSNLILQGVARVMITNLKMRPFPSVEIEVIADKGTGAENLDELRSDITEACRQMRHVGIETPRGFDEYLAQITEPGPFSDAVAAAFVADGVERRGLLEESDVSVRMSRLLRCLLRQLQTP